MALGPQLCTKDSGEVCIDLSCHMVTSIQMHRRVYNNMLSDDVVWVTYTALKNLLDSEHSCSSNEQR